MCSHVNTHLCFNLQMSKAFKKTRTLKVVTSFSNKARPLLPLSGEWLELAGFKVGSYVEVIVREECLVIVPSKLLSET